MTRIALSSLDQAWLDKNKNLELLISGHTDNVGTEEDNLILSANRARSVYSFLIESGISELVNVFNNSKENIINNY